MLSKCKATAFRCKRMSESLLAHCKAALSNLIASDTVEASDDPLKAFSDGVFNFIPHYCLDDHSSSWCQHDKAGKRKNVYILFIYRKENRCKNSPVIMIIILLSFFFFFFSSTLMERPIRLNTGLLAKPKLLASNLSLKTSLHIHKTVSDRGRLTTNSVEGFHGLALVYRDKRTDLCHTHYVCKTNMAICHKVGNIWSAKIFRIFFFIL